MFTKRLTTDQPAVMLVAPDIERDAPLGVAWLEGEAGRRTLRAMGVPDEHNQASTLEDERSRVAGFLNGQDHYNWMIAVDDTIVGAIWVDRTPTDYLPAPSVHIMIGDPNTRRQGIGSSALRAVIAWLLSQQKSTKTLHSRYLVENTVSKALLHKVGFTEQGLSYHDADGLAWQNVAVPLQHGPVVH